MPAVRIHHPVSLLLTVFRAAFAALLLAAVAFGSAQAQTPRRITFNEAVRIALDQNVALQRAENEVELTAIGVDRARMTFAPTLSLNNDANQSYGRQFSQIEGGIVNQQARSFDTRANASVNLFNGFRDVAALRQARLNAEAGQFDLERSRQTVVFEVLSNYLTLIERGEQIRVREENLESTRRQLEQIEEFTRVGARPISDLYQQQAAVANAELLLLQAQQQYQVAESNIIQTLKLNPFEPYEFVAPAVDTTQAAAPSYDLTVLLREAFENRPDVRASEVDIDAAREGIRVARASYFPTFGVGVSYGTNWSSIPGPSGQRDPVFDQFDLNRGGGFGFSLSIPLFDRFATRNNTQEARVRLENARLQQEGVEQEIAVQVRQSYLDFVTAQKSLSVAEAQVRSARLALEAAEERYRLGAATLVEVSQARALYVEAASQQVQAKYDYLFRQRLIDYYVGSLDPSQPLF